MLLATLGLNPGKTYQISMLSDMVWDRGVRPGHGGILSGAAKAKQRDRGGQALPATVLVSRKCLLPLGFQAEQLPGLCPLSSQENHPGPRVP